MSRRVVDAGQGSRARRWPVMLALAGAWAVVVPYLAEALGLELDVSSATEVVDHAVPGLIVLGLGALLARGPVATGPGPGDLTWLIASGVALLCGLWIITTHVPLLVDAGNGAAPWNASLVHLSAGPPAALVALRMLLLDDDRSSS